MKKTLVIILFLFMAVSVANAQENNGQLKQKTGFIDSQIILAALPEAIKAQGELEAAAKMWQARIDTMYSEYMKAIEDYKKKEGTMNQDKKLEAQQKIVGMEQEIQLFRQQKFSQGGDYYKKQEELLAPIKERIMLTIEEVAKDEHMTFVFDKTGEVFLLYADPDYDITYKVLDRMKKKK